MPKSRIHEAKTELKALHAQRKLLRVEHKKMKTELRKKLEEIHECEASADDVAHRLNKIPYSSKKIAVCENCFMLGKANCDEEHPHKHYEGEYKNGEPRYYYSCEYQTYKEEMVSSADSSSSDEENSE